MIISFNILMHYVQVLFQNHITSLNNCSKAQKINIANGHLVITMTPQCKTLLPTQNYSFHYKIATLDNSHTHLF